MSLHGLAWTPSATQWPHPTTRTTNLSLYVMYYNQPNHLTLVVALLFAPLLRSREQVSVWPSLEVRCKAVNPVYILRIPLISIV